MLHLSHILLLCSLLVPFNALSAEPVQSVRHAEEKLLEVVVNGQRQSDAALLLKTPNGLLAAAAEFKAWRIHLTLNAAQIYEGTPYYSLDAIKGLSYSIDEARQALIVNGDASVFVTTQLNAPVAAYISPTAPVSPGAFINYDLSVQAAQGGTHLGGEFELGLFNKFGVGTTSVLASDISGSAGVVRLDSTWTKDWPERLFSLRLGDAISNAGAWGRSIRFGGVQLATNFAIQPQFSYFPRPTIGAEAVLPSTVDLIVDNISHVQTTVAPGAFTLNNLPVVNGQGEISLVVTDALGRQSVLSQPYYVSTALLREGLHNYSLDTGFIRDNYGLQSNRYGRFLAVSTYRAGLTAHLTGEGRAEVLAGQQTLGLSAAYLAHHYAVVSPIFAFSHSETGIGSLLGLGVERIGKVLSFGAQSQFATAHFTESGLQEGESAPQRLTQAHLALGLRRWGSVGLNYLREDNRDRPNVKLVGLGYNVNVGKYATLNVSAFRTYGEQPNTTIGMTVTMPLGKQLSASASVTSSKNSLEELLQMQRNAPPGDGFGYRVLMGRDNSAQLQADVTYNNRYGTYDFNATRNQGQTSARADAAGSVLLLDGHPFLSRSMTDSFGVVAVPGYPGVGVYADNQLVAHTDAAGYALLPRLRPYEPNRIRLEQADLPLGAEIDTLEQDTVPYYRSGQLLKFGVRPSAGALLKIKLDDGTDMPAGAIVYSHGHEFSVAMNGEAYLTGLEKTTIVQAAWNGQSCKFAVELHDQADPLPHIGPYVCTGVKP